MRIGLALGSGGARGLAHCGVLHVLHNEGLLPAAVAGTSMGSIVGALYAETRDPEEVARRLAAYSRDPEFSASWEPFVEDDEDERQEDGFLKEWRRSLHRTILTFKTYTSPAQQSAERLMGPLRQLFRSENIEDLEIPFATVAIDLISGDPVVFTRGPLAEAVYASSAIPGVFPPLPLGEGQLVDGGGSYRVPVRDCRELGAEFVIAVDIPSFSDQEVPDRGIEILMRSDAIARNRLNAFAIRQADFVIRPEVGRFHWANFGAESDIRAEGEAAARQALPQLRRAIKAYQRPGARFRRAVARWANVVSDES